MVPGPGSTALLCNHRTPFPDMDSGWATRGRNRTASPLRGRRVSRASVRCRAIPTRSGLILNGQEEATQERTARSALPGRYRDRSPVTRRKAPRRRRSERLFRHFVGVTRPACRRMRPPRRGTRHAICATSSQSTRSPAPNLSCGPGHAAAPCAPAIRSSDPGSRHTPDTLAREIHATGPCPI